MKSLRISAAILGVVAALSAPLATLSAQQLPADEPGSLDRLNASPRHGEWVTIDAGGGDMVRAWISYPERADPAPVVVVIQEIFGLTDWIRGVADQLAADGYIAIAPDLLSGKGPGGSGSDGVDQQAATALVRALDQAEVTRRLQATAAYATALPAATDQVASLGFCWGGGQSFGLAAGWTDLDAAVVFYGTSPSDQALAGLRTPVLGLYGEDDARVNATIDPARNTIEVLGGRYDIEIYAGAGHGFLRQQDGREGANMRASEQAWPRALAFLRETIGS